MLALSSLSVPVGGVSQTAPAGLDKLPAVHGLKVLVLIMGVSFLGSAVGWGVYLLLQLGSGRLMLGMRLIRTASMAFRDISYTAVLPAVTCGSLFLLGMYFYVVGEALATAQV